MTSEWELEGGVVLPLAPSSYLNHTLARVTKTCPPFCGPILPQILTLKMDRFKGGAGQLRKRIFEYLLQCLVFLIDLGRVRISVDVPKTTKAEQYPGPCGFFI